MSDHRHIHRLRGAALIAGLVAACGDPAAEPMGTATSGIDPEDPSWGCYQPEPGHPTPAEKSSFIASNAAVAQQVEKTYGVPSAALLGMAAEEGGYGFTRTAKYARNTFGYKYVGGSKSFYTLTCQPPTDPNNQYVVFDSISDGFMLVGRRTATKTDSWGNYKPVTDQYRASRAQGVDVVTAVDAWIDGISVAGYNPDGLAYSQRVKGHMIAMGLYRYSAAVGPSQGAGGATGGGGGPVQGPPPIQQGPPVVQGPPPNPAPAADPPAAWLAIDEPAENATVSGDVPLRTTVSSGVTKVVFISITEAGQSYVIGSRGAPFDLDWATVGWVPNGTYQLRFEAWSGDTMVASAARHVDVDNP